MMTMEIDRERIEKAIEQLQQTEEGWITFDPKVSRFEIDSHFTRQEDAADVLLFSTTANDLIEYTAVPHLTEQLHEAHSALLSTGKEVGSIHIHCWETDPEFEHTLTLQFMETKELTERQNLNVAYLTDQVRNTGLPETWEFTIRENIEKGLSEFTVGHQQITPGGSADITGHFKKGKEDYFFNQYDVAAKYGNTEPLKQTFWVQRPDKGFIVDPEGNKIPKTINSTITLKEALNLLPAPDERQRWVLKNFAKKDGEIYSARISLDLTEKKEGNYPFIKKPDFDLEAKIRSLPVRIKEMDAADTAAKLIGKLNKGDIVDVTVISASDREYKRSIMVNGAHQTTSLFDGKTLLSASKAIPKEKDDIKQDNSQQISKGQKQGGSETDSDPATSQEQKPSRKKRILR